MKNKGCYGRDRRASGGPCLPAVAGVPVGIIVAEAPALLPATRTGGRDCGAAHLSVQR